LNNIKKIEEKNEINGFILEEKVNVNKIIYQFVAFDLRFCSCLKLVSFGIPCRHVIAVSTKLGLPIKKEIINLRWKNIPDCSLHL